MKMKSLSSKSYSNFEVENVCTELKQLDNYLRERFRIESDLLFHFMRSMIRAGRISSQEVSSEDKLPLQVYRGE